ncbi:hypothetical protein VTH06DRAFT_7855 [Thermothelomyces fergusii]
MSRSTQWLARTGAHVESGVKELLDDPEIDAVLIALEPPSRLQWAMTALAKGKHVFLDAPGTSNTTDAERLFNLPFLKSEHCPVLLECTPYRFHPSWLEFERAISRPNVARVKILVALPAAFDGGKNLQFCLEHSGGAGLDMGYAASLMRTIFGVDPVECLRSDIDIPNSADAYGGYTQYDIIWLFPGGAVGEMKGVAALGKRMGVPVLPRDAGVTIEVTRRVVLRYRAGLPSQHRLDIKEEAIICNRETGRMLHRVHGSKSASVYTLRPADRANRSLPESKPYWTAPLYQLDAFVNRVRRTPPSPRSAWVTPADSLARARSTDEGLRAAGIMPPPPSTFRLEDLRLTPRELEKLAPPPPPRTESSGHAGEPRQAEESRRAEEPRQADESRQPQEQARAEEFPHQTQRASTRTRDRVRSPPSSRSWGFIRAWLDTLSVGGYQEEEMSAGSGEESYAPLRQNEGSGFGPSTAHESRQTQSNACHDEVPVFLRMAPPDEPLPEAYGGPAKARSPSRSSLRSRSSARARRPVQNRASVRASHLAQVLGPDHIRVRALRNFSSLKASPSQSVPRQGEGEGKDESGVDLSRMPNAGASEPQREAGPGPSQQSAGPRPTSRSRMSARAHRPAPEPSHEGPRGQEAAHAGEDRQAGPSFRVRKAGREGAHGPRR